MFLLLFIVLLLDLAELLLLRVEGTDDKRGELAIEEVENCLRDYLADLH